MKSLLISTAVVALLATPILAQDTEYPDEKPAEAAETPTTETPDAAATEMPGDETGTTATSDELDGALDGNMLTINDQEISADTLIGQTVYAPEQGTEAEIDLSAGFADVPENWEEIGEIGDVLIDTSGSISSVVIDVGGFLGMGERDIRVELADIQIVPDTDGMDSYFAVYTGDRATIEEADLFDTEAAEEGGFTSIGPAGAHDMMMDGDASMSDDSAGMTDDSAAMTDDAAAMMDDSGDMTDDSADMTDDSADAADSAFDASDRPDREGLEEIAASSVTTEELQGARVYGSVDGWMGDISDLVLNEEGQVSHIVIDVGGWLGIGVHPVALSFEEIDLRRENDGDSIYAFVDFTQEELESMPEWTEE